SQQHGIRRRHVIASALCCHENRQRDYESPADQAETLSFRYPEIEKQAGYPQRDCEGVRRDLELVGKKIPGAADANIAGMNMVQEVERDETVPDLPDEVGQEDQERNRNSYPQPARFQI